MNTTKNIFQVWYQGCDNIEKETYKQNIANWKLLNPDWNYYCMAADDLEKACKTYSPACLAAFKKFDVMHIKIDLGKLVLLYIHGGIMVDMDMYALRSLSSSSVIKEILLHENVMGVSQNGGNYLEKRFLNNINNAVLITSKGNVLLKLWIDTIIQNIEKIDINHNYSKHMLIYNTTFNFGKFIKQHEKTTLTKLIHMDYRVFEPCLVDKTCKITDDTVAIHQYEMSWVPDEYKFIITNIYVEYIRGNFLIFLILILLGVYIIKRK